MSERSGSVLVGAFIVGSLLIAIAGALFFAGGGIGGDRGKVVMVFDGSLRCLSLILSASLHHLQKTPQLLHNT